MHSRSAPDSTNTDTSPPAVNTRSKTSTPKVPHVVEDATGSEPEGSDVEFLEEVRPEDVIDLTRSPGSSATDEEPVTPKSRKRHHRKNFLPKKSVPKKSK